MQPVSTEDCWTVGFLAGVSGDISCPYQKHSHASDIWKEAWHEGFAKNMGFDYYETLEDKEAGRKTTGIQRDHP